jgi:AbrB family looped-hinge helix DNA binding protein
MSTHTDEDRIARVSRKGQATIPKRLREEYDIDAPGRVRFRETDEGIVVEPVSNLADLRGALASDAFERGEVTERLREMREDEREREDREDARLDRRHDDG